MSLGEQARLSVNVKQGKLSHKEHDATMNHAEDSVAERLLAQLENMAIQADNSGRTKILAKLRNLSYSLETSDDTAKRLLYNNLVLAVIRTGIDLKLFHILSEAREPLNTTQLAEATGAAPVLLGRLLRYLASVAIIKETGEDTYTASNVTDAVTINECGLRFMFDASGPVFQAMPSFLKETGYADVADNTKNPWTKAWNTNLPVFQWLPTKPEFLSDFNAMMGAWEQNSSSWLNAYPLKQVSKDLLREQPLFVDVGGGLGHQAIRLVERYPELVGSVVVQDVLPTMATLQHKHIKFMQHDFFNKQPIQGAKFYYLRHIMHNWWHDKAVLILQNLKAAMAPNSVILVDEMVLPNSGASFHVTQMDMIMMADLAAMERTEKEWYALLEDAGLEVNHVWVYDTFNRRAIIEAVVPKPAKRGLHL